MRMALRQRAIIGIVPVIVSLLIILGCSGPFDAVWAIRQTAVSAAATPSATPATPEPVPTATRAATASPPPSPTPESSPTPSSTSTASEPTVSVSPEATATGRIIVYPSGATPALIAFRTRTAQPEYGIVVKRVTDGRGVAINPDKEFYAASVFKLWVMYEVFRQRELGLLAFDETVTLVPFHLDYQLGELAWPLWTEVPIGNLMEAMITVSDNIAAIMLHDKVGGWNINQDIEAIGMENSALVRGDLPTTAEDTALLLEMLALGRAINERASQDMVDLMTRQRVNDRLPALLPAGIRVAHKTGNWPSATHDVGIVYAPTAPYVLVVMSDKAWEVKQIADLSLLVYDHFEEQEPESDNQQP